MKSTKLALSAPTLDEPLAPLALPYRTALLSMYRGEPQLGADGQMHSIDPLTKISPHEGVTLYDLCLSLKPQSTIEIGMAYGYSTLYFLAAIAKNQFGHHTAIDPFQHSQWHGIGIAHAGAVTTDSAFRFIEDRADRVATDLARQRSTFDVILIDGNHRFDDVLVDFYLYASLCKIGGLIIFDDMWMSSVQMVVSFVRSNRRDFAEVSTSESNISVFRHTAEDARSWDHFQPFTVSGKTGLTKHIGEQAARIRNYLSAS